MPRIRISPTIAQEYDARCPEGIPDRLRGGWNNVTHDEVRAIHEDAKHNSDPRAFDTGRDGMPRGVFYAYRALAKQCEQITQSVSLSADATNAMRENNTHRNTPPGADMTTTTKPSRKTTARTKNSHFVKGQGVFECRCCHRRTRAVGNGDADLLDLCEPCYALAGEDNHWNDHGGTFCESPAYILGLIEEITAKGGDVHQWAEMKARAEAMLAPKAPAFPPGCFVARNAAGVQLAETDAAHAVAAVEAAGAGKVVEYSGVTPCLFWSFEGGEWWLLGVRGEKLHEQRPS